MNFMRNVYRISWLRLRCQFIRRMVKIIIEISLHHDCHKQLSLTRWSRARQLLVGAHYTSWCAAIGSSILDGAFSLLSILLNWYWVVGLFSMTLFPVIPIYPDSQSNSKNRKATSNECD